MKTKFIHALDLTRQAAKYRATANRITRSDYRTESERTQARAVRDAMHAAAKHLDEAARLVASDGSLEYTEPDRCTGDA